jgi:CRISPR/Cas system CMR subunit Cmr4 (Cas7 group RAMP superfamily)
MNPSKSIYHMAMVTLQAETAHGIHSGGSDQVQDVVLLRDVNGLPAIPGTSLAGVLRHLFQARHGRDDTDRVFGFAGQQDSHSSAIQVGWAFAHDSQNAPAEGIREDVGTDPVLCELAKPHPIIRQRVRLDARGTAEDTGKFDVSLVPAGTRYSTLLGFWSDGTQADERAWQSVLELLYSQDFRLGHGTRSGAGAFSVQAMHGQSWDLKTPEGKNGFVDRPRTRVDARKLPPADSEVSDSGLQVTLKLQSEAGWRIGGGDLAIGFGDESPDMLPQTEWRLEWKNDQASIGQRLGLLPASAVKGALLHRFAFHFRCLQGQWVDASGPESPHEAQAVKDLFGYAGEQDEEGQAGLVIIDDLYLENMETTTQMHNKIDQYTGGVMTGALFQEGLLWKTPLTLTIRLQSNERLHQLSASHREALNRTLEDLCAGRLPLGAGGSRGQGVFLATEAPQWSDQGQWIAQEVST